MEDSYKDDVYADKSAFRKTAGSKFNSTMGGASFFTERGSDIVYGEDPVEKHKKRILKKTIASVPSLDKDIRNVLIMSLQRGPRANFLQFQGKQLDMAEELRDKLLNEAKKFMDTENAEELRELLHKVIIDKDSSYDTVLKVLKLYLVSSVEKNYVEKIDEEITVGLALDMEIREMNSKVKVEKEKKSKTKPVNENIASQLRLIEQYENKIEKANQKLNEKMAKSNDIRLKIDQLRKDNLVLEQVYNKLESELEKKQKKVEETIQNAGYAYIKRNEAEEELKDLKEKAVQSKFEFEAEMDKIKEELQEVEKFKEFINGKTKEKQELENLKAAIAKNKRKIEEKQKSNILMEKEYNLSAKKEEEIKNAFERIMEKTGIKKPEDLLMVFKALYDKNRNMEEFVRELNIEIEGLDHQIDRVKQQIQYYSVRGATLNDQKRAEKTDIVHKLEHEDKKKKNYKAQYDKLIETLNTLKDMVEKVFVATGADPEIIAKVRNSALTEDNMVEFIGLLEQKGINLVGEYSRLLAEQIKIERGDISNQPNLIEDLNNLNNIIAYENANVLLTKASAPQQMREPPEDWFKDEKTDKNDKNDKDLLLDGNKDSNLGILSPEQFQQLAMSFLNAPSRKQVASSQPASRSAAHKMTRTNRGPYNPKAGKKQP